MEPFAEQRGVQITEGDYNGDYGILRERATTATGPWDVVSVEAAPTARGGREGIFSPLPAGLLDGLPLLPEARKAYAAGHLVFSTVLAYDSRQFSGASAPTGWGDFWDITKFPGKRGLRNNPRGTLEIALLAGGVEAEKLYPLDLDRAFAQLDALRPHLVFWEAGAQPLQLLANGTVAMSSAYNGRVWNAKEEEGLQVDWSWRGGLMETEYWVIPKNAGRKELAGEFIRFCLEEAQQSAFANEIAYGPTNLEAMKGVRPEIAVALPNSAEALPLQIPVNSEWWAENEAAVSARWQKWQTGS